MEAGQITPQRDAQARGSADPVSGFGGPAAGRREAMIAEARFGRDRAERLLRSLIDARSSAGRGLSLLQRPELVRETPMVESAIEGVRELMETYSRIVDELVSDMTDEDLDLIEAAIADAANLPRAA